MNCSTAEERVSVYSNDLVDRTVKTLSVVTGVSFDVAVGVGVVDGVL